MIAASEYQHVEQPFLTQLAALGWAALDQGAGAIPSDPAKSLRTSFREWLLPEVFRSAVRAVNTTDDGRAWLTDRQLDELRDQILRQPNRTLLEANEAIQALLFKTQVDSNELTGEQDPVVRLIDFANPANNRFHAINQFRIDTPGCVKQFIIPDIVLFVNGIPLAVVECKLGGPNCANPMHEAFVQLQRYRNARAATHEIGLNEGEPRLFHANLLLIRSSGAEADFGTLTSGEEHFYAWKTLWPESDAGLADKNPQQRLIQGMLSKQNLLRILRSCSVFMDTGTPLRRASGCHCRKQAAMDLPESGRMARSECNAGRARVGQRRGILVSREFLPPALGAGAERAGETQGRALLPAAQDCRDWRRTRCQACI